MSILVKIFLLISAFFFQLLCGCFIFRGCLLLLVVLLRWRWVFDRLNVLNSGLGDWLIDWLILIDGLDSWNVQMLCCHCVVYVPSWAFQAVPLGVWVIYCMCRLSCWWWLQWLDWYWYWWVRGWLVGWIGLDWPCLWWLFSVDGWC